MSGAASVLASMTRNAALKWFSASVPVVQEDEVFRVDSPGAGLPPPESFWTRRFPRYPSSFAHTPSEQADADARYPHADNKHALTHTRTNRALLTAARQSEAALTARSTTASHANLSSSARRTCRERPDDTHLDSDGDALARTLVIIGTTRRRPSNLTLQHDLAVPQSTAVHRG